ncbi:MAG: hydroxymethylbilane synthase [Candidatus Omnitrophica bacterium]|nr:hydroxymethylbilane synthase [Candidatus Omnitrophota bacterium]
MKRWVIGTRASRLAQKQTQRVMESLAACHPQDSFTVKIIHSFADRNPEAPLASMPQEGVFVKELEAALSRREIDIAVHSLKDLPLTQPPGLTLAAILKRDLAQDAYLAKEGISFEALVPGSRVGTSSLRRKSQLLLWRKDLKFLDLRGNVDTRLRKLKEGQYDAIILAACGLVRLGLEAEITQVLELTRMLPEPGQGAIAVEAREEDATALQMTRELNHLETRWSVEAERTFLQALGGGCRVPIAAFAECQGNVLRLEGTVVAGDGSVQIRGKIEGSPQESKILGQRLAESLNAQGAQRLLTE